MSSFETVLDQFGRKRVLAVGDIMLDRFVYGPDILVKGASR
jgi:bifunctional ADP-heptose synthase (sugar kinase/adenylyltransferase)